MSEPAGSPYLILTLRHIIREIRPRFISQTELVLIRNASC